MFGLFSTLVNFLNTPFSQSPEIYDFLDDLEGRMTSSEVLEIAKPLVLERGWIYENDEITVGSEKPYLVREIETGRIFWFVNFSILVVNGEEIVPQCDRTLGYVSVEDATGKVLEIKGKRN